MKLEHHESGISILHVSSDAEPYLGPHTVSGLRVAVLELRERASVRALIVVGGQRYFSAGASRESLLANGTETSIPFYAAELPRALLEIPVPTVAAMYGHGIGGGLVLGLWCDVPVLAEESLYGANFMALGFTPGMGATICLEDTLGAALGRELVMTGRMLKGRELARTALGHAVVPRERVMARAQELAEELAGTSREAALLLKATLAQRRRVRLEEALREERAMHQSLFGRDATRAQIDARYPGAAGAA
jgi:enoyl-CoA hydratase/carnithine racemase